MATEIDTYSMSCLCVSVCVCFQDETGIITPLERHLYTAFAAIFGLKGMVNTLVPQQPPHTSHFTLHRHAA